MSENTNFHPNTEMIECIHSMQVFDEKMKQITYNQLEKMHPRSKVTIVLRCEPNQKFKLKKEHYGILSAKEALLYVELGIPEYIEQEEEGEI